MRGLCDRGRPIRTFVREGRVVEKEQLRDLLASLDNVTRLQFTVQRKTEHKEIRKLQKQVAVKDKIIQGLQQNAGNKETEADWSKAKSQLEAELKDVRRRMQEQKDGEGRCQAELEETRAEVRRLQKVIRSLETDLQKHSRDFDKVLEETRVKDRALEQARLNIQVLRNGNAGRRRGRR